MDMNQKFQLTYKKADQKIGQPDKEDFHQWGLFRRTGRASAGVATGRRVFSLLYPH
jgi:hypothetical protein